jgi:Uncharacterized conserved protein
MSPRDLVYAGHMLDMAKKAVGKTHGLSREAYDADENLRLALTHLIQVIGEAGRNVSREFSSGHPEIPWADIVGLTARTSRQSFSTTTSASPPDRGPVQARPSRSKGNHGDSI